MRLGAPRKERKRSVQRYSVRQILAAEVNFQVVLLAKFVAIVLHHLGNSQLFQSVRSQFVCQRLRNAKILGRPRRAIDWEQVNDRVANGGSVRSEAQYERKP